MAQVPRAAPARTARLARDTVSQLTGGVACQTSMKPTSMRNQSMMKRLSRSPGLVIDSGGGSGAGPLLR